jgi:hypothetical protein
VAFLRDRRADGTAPAAERREVGIDQRTAWEEDGWVLGGHRRRVHCAPTPRRRRWVGRRWGRRERWGATCQALRRRKRTGGQQRKARALRPPRSGSAPPTEESVGNLTLRLPRVSIPSLPGPEMVTAASRLPIWSG